MKWLKDSDIQEFLSRHNYDLRVSGNGRWIDQKCAADVVTIIADCILEYVKDDNDKVFTSKDIWFAGYTETFVADIFKKPNPSETKARNEYDKFFQQPMKMLANAGVLIETKKGIRNFYTVGNREILEYIAIRERNALTFLQQYILKVISDSGIKYLFDDFFEKQTKDAYGAVKDGFTAFTIRHTKIKGSTECWRIFIKVLNPLAFLYGKLGTEKGRLSNGKITYDMLMYNRDNFRDIYSEKPKELTRKQYAEQIGLAPSTNLSTYMSQKAKRVVRAFNDTFRGGLSEIKDNTDTVQAINIHHIFPEAEFPDICAYYENLIALTPNQHFHFAHPQGNTGRIDKQYQHLCLLSKADVIQETFADLSCEQIYEFGKFMYVLFVGLDNDSFMQIADGDFDDAISAINLAYAQ